MIQLSTPKHFVILVIPNSNENPNLMITVKKNDDENDDDKPLPIYH